MFEHFKWHSWKERLLQVLMWPLNSPDLNLWDLLEKQVCSIEAPPQRTGLRRSNNDLVPDTTARLQESSGVYDWMSRDVVAKVGQY